MTSDGSKPFPLEISSLLPSQTREGISRDNRMSDESGAQVSPWHSTSHHAHKDGTAQNKNENLTHQPTSSATMNHLRRRTVVKERKKGNIRKGRERRGGGNQASEYYGRERAVLAHGHSRSKLQSARSTTHHASVYSSSHAKQSPSPTRQRRRRQRSRDSCLTPPPTHKIPTVVSHEPEDDRSPSTTIFRHPWEREYAAVQTRRLADLPSSLRKDKEEKGGEEGEGGSIEHQEKKDVSASRSLKERGGVGREKARDGLGKSDSIHFQLNYRTSGFPSRPISARWLTMGGAGGEAGRRRRRGRRIDNNK